MYEKILEEVLGFTVRAFASTFVASSPREKSLTLKFTHEMTRRSTLAKDGFGRRKSAFNII